MYTIIVLCEVKSKSCSLYSRRTYLNFQNYFSFYVISYFFFQKVLMNPKYDINLEQNKCEINGGKFPIMVSGLDCEIHSTGNPFDKSQINKLFSVTRRGKGRSQRSTPQRPMSILLHQLGRFERRDIFLLKLIKSRKFGHSRKHFLKKLLCTLLHSSDQLTVESHCFRETRIPARNVTI